MFKQINLTIFSLLLSIIVMAQNTVQDYVNRFSAVATSEMQRTGIPASLILAEGILASSFGNSQLALQANNHFNLECPREWNGEFFYKWDKSKQTQRPSCFRVYSKPEESFLDFTAFLISNSEIAALALDEQHYKKWVKLLVEAGATTKTVDQITRVIEQFALTDFDEVISYSVIKSISSREILTVSGIKAIVAKSDDTPLSIALELDIPYKKILKYNDLTEESTLNDNQYVYIESKRNQSDLETEYHIIRSGETLYDVAQLYGIRLKNLCKLNHVGIQDKIANGERVYLLEEAPVRPRLKGEQLSIRPVEAIVMQPGPKLPPVMKPNTEEKPLVESETKPTIAIEEDNPVADVSIMEQPSPKPAKMERIPIDAPIPGISSEDEKLNDKPAKMERIPISAPIPIMEDAGKKPSVAEKIPTGAPIPIMEDAGDDMGYIAPIPGRNTGNGDLEGEKEELAPIPGGDSRVRPQEPKVTEQPSPKPPNREKLKTQIDAAAPNDLPPGHSSSVFGEEGIMVPPSKPDPKAYLLDTDLTEDSPKIEESAPVAEQAAPPTPRAGYHIVVAGETLYRISTIYKISVVDLKKMNGLVDNTIEIGQELKIKK